MVLRNPRGITIVAAAAAIALGLALTVVAAAADARGQATTIGLIATMNGPSEVPAPTGDVSAARGAFTATASQDGTGAGLDWSMTFDGLTGPATAAHIHIAARGHARPGRGAALCSVHEPRKRHRRRRRRHARCDPDGRRLRERPHGQEQGRRDPWPGRHRRACPHGARCQAGGPEAEGQRAARDRLVRRDRHQGGDDRRRHVASHVRPPDRGGASRRTSTSAAPGRAGPVAVALCGPCRNGQRGNAVLNAATLAAIEAGRGYVNIHTKRNPAGEIRGQLPAAALRIG